MRFGRRAATALLGMVLVACGGGGGSDGAGAPGGGFSVSFDRSSVAMSFEQDSVPVAASLHASGNGTPPGPVYVGTTTPSGQPDPNIDHVEISLSGQTATIFIHPSADLPPGTYSGTLVLLACVDAICTTHHPGSPFNLHYTLTVAPTLRVSPVVVTLSDEASQPLQQQLSVALPPGVASFSVSASDPWITVDAQTADGFRISVPARPAGTYAGSIEVTAGAFRRVVPVTHIATARRLKLDRAQLDFAAPSGSTAASDVTVLQLAEGASDISVTASAPWIAVDSLTPSGFRVTAQSLPSGGHQGQVTVRSGNDVMVVPLSYVVTPPDGGDRGFLMGRSSFTFAAAQGTVSAAQSFNIARPSWNPAIGIAFSYAQGSDWLSASTTTGGDVLLVASAVGLATGTYRADVTVTPAYPAVGLTIPVMLTVGQGLAVPAPQTLVMGSDSSSATLRGSVPVVANGATSLFWTATSSVPWLQLTQASGGPGSSVEYRIDVAAALLLPGYTDHAALITIDAGTPDGPGTVAPFDSMQASVTLRRELAEVQAVGPANIVAGRPARIVLRGRGLGGLDVPAASLDIGGVTPVSVSRLNDSSMTVQLPALAAGSYDLGIKNAFGAATPKARLHVVAAQDYAPDAVATSGTPRSLVYDPLRQTLYVANETLSVLQRTRFDGSAWITDSLALPSLIDVGLSASGDTVIAITSTRLHLIDAATFTVSETFDVPDSFVRTPPTGHGLAVTNDERVWLAVGNGWSQMVYFDLPTHRFVVVRPNSGQTLFYGGPWYEVSRDGERLVIVQSAQVTPAPKALYLNASEHVFRDNPAGIDFFYWSTSGLSDTGDRLLVNGHIVFDADFAQVGRIVVPDAGWSPGAAVLSPDGRRVYVMANGNGYYNDPASTTLPRIYVFDAGVAAGTVANLPLLGRFDLPAYPSCRASATECVRPVMIAAPDGQTLFVVGTDRLVIAPVPAPMSGLSLKKRALGMKRWVQ